MARYANGQHRGHGLIWKRPPTEAALLLLLGVKRGLQRLHFLNELSDPFDRQLIGYPSHEAPIMIDLLVEFLALVAHWQFRIRAKPSGDDGRTAVLFISVN